jgi:hypothetical protein
VEGTGRSLTGLLAIAGVLGAVFYALESSLAPLLARFFPGYGALDPRRRLQVRVRSFESLASIYLCLGGIGGAVAYARSDLNYVSGYSAFAHVHALALAAFYLFHLWRMAAAGGYPRALYAHHFFMALGLLCCLGFGVLQFYMLLSAVPAGGAAVRNARWAARVSNGATGAPSPWTAATVMLLTELPAPLGGFVHLFLVGLRDGPVPGPVWVLVIGPAVASTLMAAWFVAGAFREAARRRAPGTA